MKCYQLVNWCKILILINFIVGADVVVGQSEYGKTMLFDKSVTLPNSKIFSAFISVL